MNNEKDVVVFFFFDLLHAIQSRYPAEKPICLNYAVVREDITSLCAWVRELQNRLHRLETPARKLKIGRWVITIRKADANDKEGTSEMA